MFSACIFALEFKVDSISEFCFAAFEYHSKKCLNTRTCNIYNIFMNDNVTYSVFMSNYKF